ncbi:pyocin activator PrtN family protein [Salipiger sp. 1_MG-2023]|uniref:pyocin activator PrtN family protein n=1 Tax=Salipiger sp. 1_MG-2023 TaxID=3062665 RepID=UPI0026E19D2F|nr:pyocin activator PrtN family protein [Salipiger sp. 1_MG-2023]MDO6586927.1 pyocin activator PrtN family protein [Salipiger sp. 1_MG-2023]
MNTFFVLMAKYGPEVMIPSEIVARDWFGVEKSKFNEKVRNGEIPLPVMRMEDSQKSPRGVHILDLAEYLDKRREEARLLGRT